MLLTTTVLATLSLLAQTQASVIDRSQTQSRATKASNNGQNGGGNVAAAAAAATCLSSNAVQTGSDATGQQNGVAAAGQVNSKTDAANFINFCAGKTLTNGVQVKTGSCNGVVMGDIPATTNMASTIILSPESGKAVAADTTFNVTVQIANMQLGSFTNATSTYYSAPQELQNGVVVGHTHVTIQDLGSTQTPQQALDASKFVFFKGINDAGNGAGKLTTAVTNGLPAGNYRVCTMAGSSNHQPLLMPVAQRGAQDDCIRIVVGGGGSGASGSASGASGAGTGNAAASSVSSAKASATGKGKGSAGDSGTGNAAASSVSTAKASATGKGKGSAGDSGTGNAAASTASTAKAEATGKGSADGKGGKGGKEGASTTATAAASAAATGKAKASASSSKQKVATTSAAAANPAATGSAGSTTGNAATGSGVVAASSAIAGIAAPAVADSGDATRPFSVQGNTFVNKAAAVQRACAIQNNACANAVNSGKAAGSSVGDCNTQEDACNAAGGA